MGSFFEWDQAKYSVHVPNMDAEHQRIIKCMNVLHELHTSKAPLPRLTAAMEDLAKVTVKHFADEEAHMARIGFPDLAKHKIVHQHLLGKVLDYKARFDSSGKLTDEFFAFLKMWLKSHICGIDIKYGEFAPSDQKARVNA